MPTCNLFGNYNLGLDIFSIAYKLANNQTYRAYRMRRAGLLLCTWYIDTAFMARQYNEMSKINPIFAAGKCDEFILFGS